MIALMGWLYGVGVTLGGVVIGVFIALWFLERAARENMRR